MKPRSDLLPVLSLTALALFLRLWGITADLWLDEIMTLINYMRLSPIEAATVFHSANQHLLNSVLGSISIGVLGESEWSVRLPALIFGVATIPVFFYLAKAVTNRREAIFASLFLVLSYHHVWFSQNARGYSAMIFFTVLSTLFLVRWLADPLSKKPKNWLWFSITGVLGMMSLLNFAFVLVGQLLVALGQFVHMRDWSGMRLLFMSSVLVLALSILGYATTLPSMIEYFVGSGSDVAETVTVTVPASLTDITTATSSPTPQTFSSMLVVGLEMFIDRLTGNLHGMALPTLAVAVIIALTGWLSYLSSMRLVALMLVLPSAVNVMVLAKLHWVVFPRSFLFVLPFAALILIRGSFILGARMSDWMAGRFNRPGWVAYILPVLLLLGSLLLLPQNYRYPKQNHTGSLAYIRSQAAPGDIIAVVGHLSYGYRHFYAPELAFPENLEELLNLRASGQRVWLLYSYTRDMRGRLQEMKDYIDREFQLQRKFPGTLGDGTVYLLVTPAL